MTGVCDHLTENSQNEATLINNRDSAPNLVALATCIRDTYAIETVFPDIEISSLMERLVRHLDQRVEQGPARAARRS